jgi:hypothetical protein
MDDRSAGALDPWRTTEIDGPELCRRTAHERKMKASGGELHTPAQRKEDTQIQNEIKIKRGEQSHRIKKKFIENQQDYN